eukprot:37954_1
MLRNTTLAMQGMVACMDLFQYRSTEWFYLWSTPPLDPADGIYGSIWIRSMVQLHLKTISFGCKRAIGFDGNKHRYGSKGWISGSIAGGLIACMVYRRGILRLMQAFVGEIFFTYLLTTTVLHTATDKRQEGNQFYGLCIGLTVSMGIACIGPISGCCLNTAVYLGAVIPALITNQTVNGISDLWVYWVGTFLGAILAGLWFNLVNGRESLGIATNMSREQIELEQHLTMDDDAQTD